MILSIDPGTIESAWLLYDDAAQRPVSHAKEENEKVLSMIRGVNPVGRPVHRLAIEMVASYGMPVGKEVFETVLWIGRFYEAWCRASGTGEPPTLVYRIKVKLHICGQARAKDGNVRQALIDRFGGKEAAIGNKKKPGPLRGISGDVWSALAIAVTATETEGART